MVLVEKQYSGRASLSNYGRRRRCCREEGGARAHGCGCPSLPSLYIGVRERGGAALPLPLYIEG